MFSLICVWINGWVNNGEAGDLRRHRAHYVVTVMWIRFGDIMIICQWPLITIAMLRVNTGVQILCDKAYFEMDFATKFTKYTYTYININMSSYQNMNSHGGEKRVLRLSDLHPHNLCTDKTASLLNRTAVSGSFLAERSCDIGIANNQCISINERPGVIHRIFFIEYRLMGHNGQ